MHRRDFCVLLASGPSVVLAGCATLKSAPFTVERDRLALLHTDLDANGAAVLAGHPLDTPVYVRRTEEGGYDAVYLECTHRGCTVRPSVDRLECPCHGSEFTFRGDVLHGPATRPLRRLDVQDDGDRLLVEVP